MAVASSCNGFVPFRWASMAGYVTKHGTKFLAPLLGYACVVAKGTLERDH